MRVEKELIIILILGLLRVLNNKKIPLWENNFLYLLTKPTFKKCNAQCCWGLVGSLRSLTAALENSVASLTKSYKNIYSNIWSVVIPFCL